MANHMQFLRSHGCNVYQGYYFSRPVTASEFEELVRRSNHPASGVLSLSG